ncbi:MAG: NuoM family protein [Planctomycetota bacterium]
MSGLMDCLGLLDLMIAFPLAGALLLGILPSKRNEERCLGAFFVSFITLVIALCACISKYRHLESLATSHDWLVSRLGCVRFALDIPDGLSASLVVLTALLTPLVVLVSARSIERNSRTFYASILVLEAGLLGTFMATDLFTFYISWESVLIPMLLMIGIWGGSQRVYAAQKLFLFTMAGSLPLLGALLALSWNGGQFETDLGRLTTHLAQNPGPVWAFWAMALAFAIKLPLIPLHTWLPDAHTEAPTAGSVILAGVMLKMGTYGFLRLAFPFYPGMTQDACEILGWVAALGVVWGALMALAQTDIKRLIAYSSVSHLGTCMLGIFSLNEEGFIGGQMQMINHGISTGLLFLVFGMLYERGHSRDISAYGGLARKLPLLTIAFVIATLSSVGLPLTNGFVGEFAVLVGSFSAKPAWGIIAATGVVLGAVYMLRLVRLVFFGEFRAPRGSEEHLHDLSAREILVLLPLLALVFVLGIKPSLLTNFLPSFSTLVRGAVS